MKALTAEWVEKAEGDLHSCLREVRARQHTNPDSACFHAQQCAEKYPRISASKADARKALVACRAVRRAVRQSLKLKD